MRIMRKAALIMCAAFVALATIGCEKEPKPTPEPGPDPVDPAKPLVEGTFEVKVDDLTADSVTITITPSDAVDYYYACLASDTQKYLGGEDEVIVMDQLGSPNAENMIFRGEQSLTFSGLIGHSHYRLLYFQYDSEKKRIFGDLHRSERITTPDGEESIGLEVRDVTGLSANFTITPEDKEATYYFWLDEVSDYEDSFEDSDNVLIQHDFAFWQYAASLYEGTDWKEIMRQDLRSGDIEETSDNLYNLLEWGVEYMAYAYGIDEEGNITTQMTKRKFTTKKPETKNTTFEAEITKCEWDVAFNKYIVEAHVTPSDPDAVYFITITNMDWYEWYFSSDNTGRNDEAFIQYEILKNTSRPSCDIVRLYCLVGEEVYKPFEVRSQNFTPNKRYGIFIFGMSEDGPTTPLFVEEFTTPDRPKEE